MKAVIIGAGVGGLACGIRLLAQGFQVVILEKNETAGGRCARRQEAGFTFDTGPTLLMMPDTLEELFQYTGRSLAEYLCLKRIDPAYRITYSDGQALDYGERMKSLEREVLKFGLLELRGLYRYLEYSSMLYRELRRKFIDVPLETPSRYLDMEALALLLKAKPWRSVLDTVEDFFASPHLRMAFSFHTLYLGISPMDAPSLYSMLAYIDLVQGVYYPEGGMAQIPAALSRLFTEMGGEIRYSAEVEQIITKEGRVREVLLHDERAVPADIVISNVDLPTTVSRFLRSQPATHHTKRVLRMEKGCSAAVFLFGLNRSHPQLRHHNLYLPLSFEKSLEQLFRQGRIPEEPAFYLCAPTRTDRSMAPEGCESVMVLVPVPNQERMPDSGQAMALLREKILNLLDRTWLPGIRQQIVVEKVLPPGWYASRYALAEASTFGLTPRFFQSAMFRPQRRSPDIRGLYYAGASTHPGNGIPIVLIAGRLAAEAIAQDYAHKGHVASSSRKIAAVR
ncbi:MAG: phytoene desaturase family protein [Candidatus Omnitrophica bacterium]|nr:phytoene desaturase family protein [Candidatus Omnitrophota bacterium]